MRPDANLQLRGRPQLPGLLPLARIASFARDPSLTLERREKKPHHTPSTPTTNRPRKRGSPTASWPGDIATHSHTQDMPEPVHQRRIPHVEVDAAPGDLLQPLLKVVESRVSPLHRHREHGPDAGNCDRHVDLPGPKTTEERAATGLRRVVVTAQEGPASVSPHRDRRTRPDPVRLKPPFNDQTTGYIPPERADAFPRPTIRIGMRERGDHPRQADRCPLLNRHGTPTPTARTHRSRVPTSHPRPRCKPQ